MKNYLKFTLLFVISLFCKTLLLANASLEGQVLDQNNNQAVEGVNIILFKAADSIYIKAAITDHVGRFIIEQIPQGEYFIKVSYLGYNEYNSERITINSNKVNIDLGEIYLVHSSINLQEVTVTASKPFITKELDKLVLNVENSIVSTGGSALEVLERAPGITMSQEDNISMRGKSGIILMIDGKVFPLSGADLVNYLRSLPANSIEKIELITNPSSRYDAGGNAGIINIQMKKDKRLGTNGSVSLTYSQGYYPKGSPAFNFNHRNKKINLFGGYSYNYRKQIDILNLRREFYDNENLDASISQYYVNKIPINTHNSRLGFDVFPSSKTTIGAVGTFFHNAYQTLGRNEADIFGNQQVQQAAAITTNRTDDRWKNYSINGNLKQIIDTLGQELNIDLDYAQFNNQSDQNFTTDNLDINNQPYKPQDFIHGDIKGDLSIKSLKADYVKPLQNKTKIEAGFKTSFVKADNDLQYFNRVNNVLEPDTGRTNHFIYDENINALYANYRKEFKKFSYQIGLRMEQTNVDGNQVTKDINFSTSYTRLFPTAYFQYMPNEKNEWSIAVNRRIGRPSYQQLNPFRYFVDPLLFKEGNPYLQPSFTYSFEFSYSFNQKIFASLSYSIVDQHIGTIIVPYDIKNRVIYQTDINMGIAEYYSAALSFYPQITNWWNLTLNLNSWYGEYTGQVANTNVSRGNLVGSFYMNNNFILGKGFTAEISGNLHTNEIFGILLFRTYGQVGAGIQKSILNQKGSLRLNMTDIFLTNVINSTSSVDEFSTTFKRRRDTQIASLSFNYRFGSSTVSQSRRRASGAEEEKQRANS